METRAIEFISRKDRAVVMRAMEGHFVTQHSHVTHCIDLTQVKSQIGSAKGAAKLFAESFRNSPVDTIITLERTKMVGAFLAEELAAFGINVNKDIAVISPEITGDKMILRDNFIPYVRGRHVLLLTATATTGMTVMSALEGIRYYGGEPAGAATVFGGNFGTNLRLQDGRIIPVTRLFNAEDIRGYRSYAATNCPLCGAGKKVDALINSYGYSKI